MKVPKELRIAAMYSTVLEVLGREGSLSDSSGSTKPNIGERKIVPKVALSPIEVSSAISPRKRLSLSPTQVHSPAITPVRPASGPTDAPNSSGNSAAPSIENTL